MKTIIKWLLRIWFGFRADGLEALSTPGPVLLIPNHVSWLDWAFLYAVLEDDWRFVTSSRTAELSFLHRKVMVNERTFPIDNSSPYAARRMAEYLQKGGRLVLFAEGRISSTSARMKLFEGTGFLVHKTRAKVITAYLRNAVRSPFVRHTGWTRWFSRVSLHIGPTLTPPHFEHVSSLVARRHCTRWLWDQMARQQYEVELAMGPRTVLAAIAEMASNLPGKLILEDIQFKALSYRRLMVGVDVLSKAFAGLLTSPSGANGASREERVGVLLPNVNAMPVSLMALWACGRVPAILNFSTGSAQMLECIRLAGVKQVITSKAFLEKARLDLSLLTNTGIGLIYLEDVREGISKMAKLAALLRHTIRCGGVFREKPPSELVSRVAAEDPMKSPGAVILFTSGSEGVPKGVELSQRNLMANLCQIVAHLDLTDHERFFNALPLFHSFGLTACTLLPLVRGLYTFLYPSPLHYRVVPAAIYETRCTVVVGTNTFLNGYARRAHSYDFHTVKYLVAGAEKLQENTANTWARQFGVRILEGYGATECGPVLAANSKMDPRFGSVGRFLPGIEWRLETVEGIDEGGRLFVRGPNIMRGYLNSDANAAFLALGGWYDTGDIARLDDDGFLYLLGRLKRFAKISGEMVSLTAVEDALAGAFKQFGARCEVAVVAVPDDDKGERLIAFANDQRVTTTGIREAVQARGLPNLCVPREVKFVREIPKLGTGKINHRELISGLKKEEA